MTALTFSLKKNPPFKVDCSPLTPDKLSNLSPENILEITLNNSIKVTDLFEVFFGDFNDILFKKSSEQLDLVGHQMSRGRIIIEGDCGDFLGTHMHGGTIVCQGNAGDRIADRMRRGLILVEGNAGDYAASRMIAGTVGINGAVGKHCGYMMKRGTILLKRPPKLGATMADCGAHDLPFLKLLAASLRDLPSAFSGLDSIRAQRYCGDIAANGTGEILVFQP